MNTQAPLYSPAVMVGSLLFVSGQLPVRDGELIHPGRVGADVTVAQAQEAARLCALNCLDVARSHDGGAHEIVSVVKLGGYVSVADGFVDAPIVVDAASKVVADSVKPDRGHARVAVGVASLPRNASVEIEMILHMAPAPG